METTIDLDAIRERMEGQCAEPPMWWIGGWEPETEVCDYCERIYGLRWPWRQSEGICPECKREEGLAA